jgi:hypothetical protein
MGGHTLSVFSRSHACAKLIDRYERERQHLRQLRNQKAAPADLLAGGYDTWDHAGGARQDHEHPITTQSGAPPSPNESAVCRTNSVFGNPPKPIGQMPSDATRQ